MRRKPAGRLQQIADVAVNVLSQQGYRLTQMADVARECGLSAGALYSYVEGKEALLHLALTCAFGMELDDSELPYRIISPEETVNLLKREIKRSAAWPVLSEKARLPPSKLKPDDFAMIAAEMYDMMHSMRRSIWLLDRCTKDIPKIASLFLKQVKMRYIEELATLISAGQVQGLIRRNAAPPIAARAILEMIAWIAMHRLRDPLPLSVSDDEARQTAISLVTNTLSDPEWPARAASDSPKQRDRSYHR